ncbi:MAG: CDGSH iron-sulfur domain-containing protein [Candidatus Margulisiibacteriota bacterium]|jgi:CDGSH-type Zn-finger protein
MIILVIFKEPRLSDKKPAIKVTTNGPYLVSGGVKLAEQEVIMDSNGDPKSWQEGKVYESKDQYSLCRCGKSKKVPYCDGAHVKEGFFGRETAKRTPFIKAAKTLTGPELILKDQEDLCVGAGFCHRRSGTWNLTTKSDNPGLKAIAVQQAEDCPAGRLVAVDKRTGQVYEREFEASIGLVEEPISCSSGPLWVRGNIPVISDDGKQYEVRNRVTLCRCGESNNRPFCDGTHRNIGFSAK